MAIHKFKVAEPDGRIKELIIEGDSESEALTRLRRRNLTPLKYLGAVTAESGYSGRIFGRSKFNIYDFTDRLAPLLKAHIPLARALEIIASGTEDRQEKEVIHNLRRGLHEGKKFSELIRNSGIAFPPIYANLIETGERTGHLPEMLGELQVFLNERRETRDFIISSSIYPVIILTIASAVMLLIFTVFIPRFSRIFIDMGRELPLSTRILIAVGHTVTSLWWLWLTIAGAIITFFTRMKHYPVLRRYWDCLRLKIPLIGPITAANDMNRFIHALAVMLKNHVKLLETVELATRIIQNSCIRQSFSALSKELRNGVPLSDALNKSPYIPKDAVQMLKVGEESGRMGEMLAEVSAGMNNKMRIKIKRLLAIFEPAVIVILALIIALVVLSIFMAIMDLNKL
jgi:type II secretory pathway component PulF